MTIKAVIPREQANLDVEESVDYYLSEGGRELALRFISSLEKTFALIGRPPAIGSARYSQVLNLPGLRYALLNDFPHLVFYVEYQDHVDVWRLLHAQRDIPARLQASPKQDVFGGQ